MKLSDATLDQLEALRQALKFTIEWDEDHPKAKSSDKEGHLKFWVDKVDYAIASKKMEDSLRPVKTREQMISLFTFDGRPYSLRYSILGHQRKDWLKQKPVIDAMIKAGEVEIIDKDRKSITYHYKG